MLIFKLYNYYSTKKNPKIAFDLVATFSLQPLADVGRAHLQQRG